MSFLDSVDDNPSKPELKDIKVLELQIEKEQSDKDLEIVQELRKKEKMVYEMKLVEL